MTDEAVEKALRKVIKAWDALEGGKNYRPSEVENWLVKRMGPAISNARKALGEPLKDE